jgi:hypothetical protein
MIQILQWFFWAAELFLLWQIWSTLKVIARDTQSREELADTIEKFAALAGEKKIVAFRAKKKDHELQ